MIHSPFIIKKAMVLYHSLWGSHCVFVRCSVIRGWFRLLAWSICLFFCRNYNVRGVFRSHELRHTFATLSLKNGVDVKTLSSTLGHYSAGFMLSTYTHATPEIMREAADTMGNVIGKAM